MTRKEFQQGIRTAIESGQLEWHRHSLERMLERDIDRSAILHVLQQGDVIEDYVDDYPYPSGLFFGTIHSKPIHVVAAFDPRAKKAYVITAYQPDLHHFEPDFRTRRDR